jgi:hypothetical protein
MAVGMIAKQAGITAPKKTAPVPHDKGRFGVEPMQERERRARDLREAIRQVLLHDWDPIAIADEAAAQDEYDSYVGGVYRLLASGASEGELERHLRRILDEQMGLSGEVDCSGVAKKLLALKAV